MIQTITAFDRHGSQQTFNVKCVEDYLEDDDAGYPYYGFEISHPQKKTNKNFGFEMVKLSDDRMMILAVSNFNVPEYSEKGIVKAMIKAVSKAFNCDVVSASNPNSEIWVDDGREPFVTKYWEKWCGEMDNVSYLKEEDRFIYRRV